jgi:hypothetical protein
MHPIQDLFLKSFSDVLQIDMHFICAPMWTKKFILVKSGCHIRAHERGNVNRGRGRTVACVRSARVSGGGLASGLGPIQDGVGSAH